MKPRPKNDAANTPAVRSGFVLYLPLHERGEDIYFDYAAVEFERGRVKSVTLSSD